MDPDPLAPPPASAGAAPPTRPPWIRRTDAMVLATVIVAYTAFITYCSLLRYENFFTSNWDMGIAEQMLWTTGHGYVLWEAGDFIAYGTHSFLEVHSTYIALIFAPLYDALPSISTLFVLQAAAAAVAVVPLYLISMDVLRSRSLAYAMVTLYLVAFSVLSGLMYDFHWEAFLPVEFLALWYLYAHRRYAWALVVLVVGCCTLEVFPFLAVLVPVVALLGSGPVSLPSLSQIPSAVRSLARKVLSSREGRIAVVFILACIAAYVAILAAQQIVIPRLLGDSATGAARSSSVLHSLLSLVSFSFSPTTLLLSAAYWILTLAAVGFLAIVRPRYLLLLLPWFLYATFIDPGTFGVAFGNQYSLIVIGPLLVATIYGVAGIRDLLRNAPARRSQGAAVLLFGSIAALGVFTVIPGTDPLVSGTTAGALKVLLFVAPALVAFAIAVLWLKMAPSNEKRRAAVPDTASVHRPHVRRVRPLVIAAFVVLVGVNLAMSPFNTANHNSNPGYFFSWTPNPVSAEMGTLVGEIPSGATLLSSDFLFPYVANDDNAYAAPWYQGWESYFPYFPFSSTNLPAYVLTDSVEFGLLPSYIQSAVHNSSVYGLRGVIESNVSYPGTVYLYELGYRGLPTTLHAARQPAAGDPPRISSISRRPTAF